MQDLVFLANHNAKQIKLDGAKRGQNMSICLSIQTRSYHLLPSVGMLMLKLCLRNFCRLNSLTFCSNFIFWGVRGSQILKAT